MPTMPIMPNSILFATSTFFDSQFALLLLLLLALAAFGFALLVSHGVITQRDAADAREIAALPEIMASLGDALGDSLGDEPSARMETSAAESGRQHAPEPNLGEWSA